MFIPWILVKSVIDWIHMSLFEGIELLNNPIVITFIPVLFILQLNWNSVPDFGCKIFGHNITYFQSKDISEARFISPAYFSIPEYLV